VAYSTHSIGRVQSVQKPVLVDVFDHGGEGGGLSAASDTCDDDEALDKGRDLLHRGGRKVQLERWAERLAVPCVKGPAGGDPAAVAFDAVDAARTRGLDTVLVDTAGRLHTQDDLMKELQKVARVVAKKSAGAPHETLLVLDGSSGQNIVQQGRIFSAALSLTGVMVTKLDGTARGGAVVALRRDVGLPVRFLGVGETADDLEVFDARAYARRLLAD
jgi:fused signal recognition particle receptor